jgi:hypothetical protein
MMGLAVVWVVASLLAAGMALQYLFTTNIERTAREDLDAALVRLAAAIVPGADGPLLGTELPDPRYTTPFAGRYWQVRDVATGETARSRSLWDFVIDEQPAHDALYHRQGPEDRRLIVRTRQIEVSEGEQGRTYLVTVAQDYEALHEAVQRFSRDVTLVLTGLGAFIIPAAWLQIRIGLSPNCSLWCRRSTACSRLVKP